MPDALDFLDEIDPQPMDRWGMVPVWVWMQAAFRILDPATGRPLAGQDPERFRGIDYEWRMPLGTSGLKLTLRDHALLAAGGSGVATRGADMRGVSAMWTIWP